MRKILTILITVVLLANFIPVSNVFAEEMIFSDPNTEQFLNVLRGLEIFSLYEDERMFFNDSEPVTRAEAAQAITSILGCKGMGDPQRVSTVFLDVPEFHKAASDIDVMLSLGIMIGMNNGNFEPDSPIQLQAFSKAMVCALGWKWKAELNGGYPPGYLTTAYTMGLLKGVEGSPENPLTRAQLVRILYNALDIPIYEIEGQSGTYKTLKSDEDINVLSQYNDIYKDKAVVNSNAFSSLNSGFAPKSDKVLIGDIVLDVNGRVQISNYIGYEVEFYYRKNSDGKKQLMYFTPTSINQVHTISHSQFDSYSNGKVYYYQDDAHELSVSISNNAGVLLNCALLQRNVAAELSKGAGRMVLISNDGDTTADVVIIERSRYDKVKYVDASQNTIYCVNSAIDLSNSESVSISDENGYAMTLSDLLPDDVLEIVADESSEFVRIYVLRNSKRAYVKETDKKSNSIITEEGEQIKIADGANETYAQLGKTYTLCINRFGEAVWLTEQKMSGYQLGYLIKVEESKELFTTEVVFTVLQDSGETARYTVIDKLKINGKSKKPEEVKSTLASIKRSLNLYSDGETSQLIYYTTEGEVIKEVVTAEADNLDKDIILKCNPPVYVDNSKNPPRYYTHTFRQPGYDTGIFDGKYAISAETKIFKVPNENQEDLEDDYFGTLTYKNNTFTDGSDSDFVETYVSGKDEIVPFAAVWYTKDNSVEISKTASFFLVESVKQALDQNESPVTVLTGCYQKAKTSFMVKDDVVVPELHKGDVVVFSLDAGNKIKAIDKVFDYATETIMPNFRQTDDSVKLAEREIKYVKVYNAPQGSQFIEFVSNDYTGGPVDPDDITLISLAEVRAAKSKGISICYNGEVFEAKEPAFVSSYINNSSGCATALIRLSKGYGGDIVYYSK